jgi:hypothetical protein
MNSFSKIISPIPGLDDIGNPVQRQNIERHLKNCVFVSHSSIDDEFIKINIDNSLDHSLSIATYTQEDGTWVYPYGILRFNYARTKDMYKHLVNIALKQCTAFVVIVSKNAVKSEWVRKEIIYASSHFDKILAIQIDDMSFTQFKTILELPDAFVGPDQVLSVHMRHGMPIEISHLLAVATHYFRLRYITPSGVIRPLGHSIVDK